MKPGKINLSWEIDVTTPNCASLAVREEPYLSLLDISQRYWLTDREISDGIRSEDWVLDVVEEELYERLIADLSQSKVPEHLWPDINRLECRWRFGKDKWSGQLSDFYPFWVEVELVEKS